MMRKLLLLLTLLLTSEFSYAQKDLSQDYTYTLSSPYKVFDAPIKLYFYKNNEILTVKVDRKQVLLQKFENGEKIKFKSEKMYEGIFPKQYWVENVIEFNDRFYFIYSKLEGNKAHLFVREIDFKKGEFIGESKLMFTVDGQISGGSVGGVFPAGRFVTPGIQYPGVDMFDFLMSNDKKKMIVVYKMAKAKSAKKGYDVIGMHAYNANLEREWNKDVEMPYAERRMEILDYTADKKSNAYILAKVFHDDSEKDKKKKSDTTANYQIEVLRISSESNTINNTKIEIGDNFINKLSIAEGVGDYMVCAGFINRGKNKSSTDGIVVFKVKNEGDIYEKYINQIPLEIVNQYLDAKQKRKNERKAEKGDDVEIESFVMDKIHLNPDGSLVVIGEQVYEENLYTSGKQYTSFYYNDIIVSKIDVAGKLSWIKKLPKRQFGSSSEGGMSYKHFFLNDTHYVVYLDNIKNFNLAIDEAPAVHWDSKGGYFTSYKISDSTGDAKKSSVFNLKDANDMTLYQFSVGRIIEMNHGEFAIEFYKKDKQDVMLKVKML